MSIKLDSSRDVGPRSVIRVALSALAAASLTVPASGSASHRTEQQTTRVAKTPLEFTGYVVDQAGSLSASEQLSITQRLGRFQRETRHQLVVVIVKSLNGEDVANFTKRLANRWGVGRKGIDDGIVLLVAPHDRKARVSVGRGLEKELPDAFCQQVMDRVMVPAFAHDDIRGGIDAGVSAINMRLSTTAANVR